jgi:hypothetical protein
MHTLISFARARPGRGAGDKEDIALYKGAPCSSRPAGTPLFA